MGGQDAENERDQHVGSNDDPGGPDDVGDWEICPLLFTLPHHAYVISGFPPHNIIVECGLAVHQHIASQNAREMLASLGIDDLIGRQGRAEEVMKNLGLAFENERFVVGASDF